MKIGLFTSDFPFRGPFALGASGPEAYRWGGVAEVVYHLALSLNAQGHSVKVFTISPTRDDIVQEHDGITVYRYGRELQVASTLLSTRLLWKPLEHELDVAHGHLGTPPGAYAALAYAKARFRPLVVTLHTTYNDVSLEGGSSVRRLSLLAFEHLLCPPLLRSADSITAVSSAVMHDTPAFRGFVPQATVVPNGVDINGMRCDLSREECRRRFGIGPDQKVVLYVGSLSAYKSPDTLLSAFGRLAPENPDACLVMLGDGPLREGLASESRRLGIEGQVKLPGFVSEEDKLRYYRAADIFTLPSLGDAFGLVLLEAAAFGLPLVATDLEVFRPLVEDGRNGRLFRPRDEADLSHKLAALLKDDEARKAMGACARATAERFGWPSIMERYSSIYRQLGWREGRS